MGGDDVSSTLDELERKLRRLEGRLGAAAPPAGGPPAGEPLRFGGDVVVEVAGVRDVAALAGLEAALRSLPAVQYAAVRRLEAGRAVLDVRLSEPSELALELLAASPVAFSVAARKPATLALELERPPAGPAG